MDKGQLIARLNWFYSLELNQVDLYMAQSKAFANEYAGPVFERLAQIEQGHVENISRKIRELGHEPISAGDVLAPILGSTAGKLLSLKGLNDVLKADIMLEQKAMKDYKHLINSVKNSMYGSKALIDLLQFNFIDENLHTEWFKTKLSELQTKEFSFEP